MEIANMKSDMVEDRSLLPGYSEWPNSASKDQVMKPHEENAGIPQGRGRRIVGSARQLWEHWKRIARKIGDFQARALMTVFYFVILGPLALAIRWRSDPLAIKPSTLRGWGHRDASAGAPMEQARRQF
jgi:hypothetical protein